MDRTNELHSIAATIKVDSKSSAITPKAASPFILSASELYKNLILFERLLRESSQAYIGYLRYYPRKNRLGNLAPFSEEDRAAFSEEIANFISNAATQIQKFHQQLDNYKYEDSTFCLAQHQYYRLVVSTLLQKLNKLTVSWEKLQKLHKKKNINPCRLFSENCLSSVTVSVSNKKKEIGKSTRSRIESILPTKLKEKIAAIKKDNNPKDLNNSLNNDTSSNNTTNDELPSNPSITEDKFAQRYIDEITTPQKLQEYKSIAARQKQQLIRENRSLERRYSQEVQLTQRMERTVVGIASLVNEFATMLEQQSGTVVDIHDVSTQVTTSVQEADQELLKTIERTQSQQWNMLGLVVTLAVMLLLLHFLTP